MKIFYGGRSLGGGCYTSMHKKRACTQKRIGGYIAPLLTNVKQMGGMGTSPDMNRVIGKLQSMNIGAGFGAPKKRVSFTF
jgi:hypothetical protein